MIAFAWAKLDAGGNALPLADHGTDVAAVLRALIERSAYRTALESAAGRPLSEQTVERLLALAFLHDMGKANAGFWRRQAEGAPRVGHTEEVIAVFAGVSGVSQCPEVVMFGKALRAWGALELFLGALAHHGRPLESFSDQGGARHSSDIRLPRYAAYWRPVDGYDPLAQLAGLLDAARARFPVAFADGPPISDAPRFVGLFCGLLSLADWIGSDAARFRLTVGNGAARPAFAAMAAGQAIGDYGLERRSAAWDALAAATFADAFGFTPFDAQTRTAEDDLGPIVVLEAETGSGKTEAALWRFLRLAAAGRVDGLYFALPTRTAATQIHARLNRDLKRILGPDAPGPVLAVPGYIRAGDEDGKKLPDFEVLWSVSEDDDGSTIVNEGRWAAEAPKRFLAARVAVGTVDQALMAGLQIRHAHLRAAALSRSLLVVDEVHASDTYMTEVLKTVIRNHVAVGGYVLLLSATLGAAARAGFFDRAVPPLEEAVAERYPLLTGSAAGPIAVKAGSRMKKIAVQPEPIIGEPRAIAALALDAARQGASVLVVRNRVDDAVAVARALEALAGESEQSADADLLFRLADVATLHHGRFAPADRTLLDEEVEAIFGKAGSAGNSGGRRRPVVLVGTQTLEQSLDIDADLLLTDLAPMDVLLQRFGRLHRHERGDRGAFAAPRAIVLVPSERNLTPFLKTPRHGLGPFRDGRGIYPDIVTIEATWALLETNPEIVIPRDNRRLVEGATHPDALDAIAAAQGTRWVAHAGEQEGGRLFECQVARQHSLDMGKAFSKLLFPSDEAIRTRLGAADRLIDLPEVLPGPFGRKIARLRIPGWMAAGMGPEPTVAVSCDTDEQGALHLLVDKMSFCYDRFGLRKTTICGGR